MTYIAFLRAINVGGHVVKMERMRQLFTELGLSNVRSYIQSGNVFFETDETDREELTRRIEHQLHSSLGYEVAAFLRTIPELEASLALDPFRDIPLTEVTRHCILFTSQPFPATEYRLPLSSPKGDCTIVAATSGEVFMVLTLVNGRPSNPSAFLEKMFKGTQATTRFFHTTKKILLAAKELR